LRPKLWVLLITLLCGLWKSAQAQTAYGPGGLFVHPTAFVPARGTTDLNVSYFSQQLPPQRETEWLPVSLSYAVTDRAQLSALYVHRRAGAHQGDSGGLFGKYQIAPDTARSPAFALAGSFLSGDVKLSSLSGVLSHTFRDSGRPVLSLHLGGQWARRADIAHPQDSVGGFIGAEAPLGRKISLVGEWGTRFRFDPSHTSALGLMWNAGHGVRIGLGYVNVGRSRDNRFLVGVGYRLGGNQ